MTAIIWLSNKMKLIKNKIIMVLLPNLCEYKGGKMWLSKNSCKNLAILSISRLDYQLYNASFQILVSIPDLYIAPILYTQYLNQSLLELDVQEAPRFRGPRLKS